MKIAVEGCAHGELDKIYESIALLETENDIKVDLLIICGDFQSVRNPVDLECMAVPPKYRQMNTFYKYYSGEKKAPILTVFIGGNHEASNYLSELSYGGWVCPNIYYMGYANVITFGGIRIAGLSGIFKGRDYLKGHFECPPYNESSKKSVYHVRNVDVFRLKQIQDPVDICVSHDWPRGVYHHGNKKDLLRWKPFFKEEMESNTLGSQAAEELLEKLKPSYWFAAHLHCKFTAIVHHKDLERPVTKFLALDKCLPRRNFLQILDIAARNDTLELSYDPEWLCILRNTNHLLNTAKRNSYMPGVGSDERWDFSSTPEEMQNVQLLFKNDLRVPDNFSVTAPTFNPSQPSIGDSSLKTYINPQTQVFCRTLDITDPFMAVTTNSTDSVSISDFSCVDTDLSFSSIVSLNLDVTQCSDDDSNSGSTSKDESATNTKDFIGEKTPEFSVLSGKIGLPDIKGSDIFFIDKIGSNEITEKNDNFQHDLDSNDFCIDKSGSHPNSLDSSDFIIDRTGSQKGELDSSDFCLEKSDSQLDTSSSSDFTINHISKQSLANKQNSQKRKSSDLLPKSNTFLQNQLCSTPITEKTRESFPEINVENVTSDDPVSEQKPQIKKFKRRNLSLYQSECDISM